MAQKLGTQLVPELLRLPFVGSGITALHPGNRSDEGKEGKMATKQAITVPLPIVVTITPVPGGDPRVVPARVVLSRRENHAVEWQCTDPDAEWSVEFDENDCPFAEHRYHAQSRHSGPVRGEPRERPYKYDVVVNGRRLDPDVVVNP
jgi:hypothetical protein